MKPKILVSFRALIVLLCILAAQVLSVPDQRKPTQGKTGKGGAPVDVRGRLEAALSKFEDRDSLQLCIALSSKIDGQAVVEKMKEVSKWSNIQTHQVKDVSLT